LITRENNMPVTELPAEVAAQINGEMDLDPIIAQQVADDRAGLARRELPEEFIWKVRHASEYAMRHLGLDEDECCSRRHRVDDWLDTLRWGNRYDEWWERITVGRHIYANRRTPEELAEENEAKERAERLLRSALSTKQLGELDRRGYFHVVVGERRFRITRGRSHNIKEVDARGRILRSLCAHPVDQVPDPDTMLAQKLWLESKPEEFFKIANVMRHRRRPQRARPLAEDQRENLQIVRELREQRVQEVQQAILQVAQLEEAILDATAAGVQTVEPHVPVQQDDATIRAA
jgi:hypothetical protein